MAGAARETKLGTGGPSDSSAAAGMYDARPFDIEGVESPPRREGTRTAAPPQGATRSNNHARRELNRFRRSEGGVADLPLP